MLARAENVLAADRSGTARFRCEEDGVAKRSRQTILKRQREVKKAEKAALKREKRAARKEQGSEGPEIDYSLREEMIAEAAAMFSDVPKGLGAGEE